MGTLIHSALPAHIVADFLAGTTVTDLGAGAIGTLTALNAQIYAGIALVAFLAIGRSVNQIFALRTPMCGKYR